MSETVRHEPHDGFRVRPPMATRLPRNNKPPHDRAATGALAIPVPEMVRLPEQFAPLLAVATAVYQQKRRIALLVIAAACLAGLYGLVQPSRHAITTVLEIGRAQPDQDRPLEQPQNALVRLKTVDIPAALASLYGDAKSGPSVTAANPPKSNAITLTSYATKADAGQQIELHQAITKALLDEHGRMLQPMRDRIANSLRLGAIEMKSSMAAAKSRERSIEDKLAAARQGLSELLAPATIARNESVIERKQQAIARQLAALRNNSAVVTNRLKQAEVERALLATSIGSLKQIAGDVRAGKPSPASNDLLLETARLEMDSLQLQQRLLVGIPSAIFDMQASLSAIADQQLPLTEAEADLGQQLAGLSVERAKQQKLLEARITGIGSELDDARAVAQRATEVAQQKQADLQASLDSALPTRVMIAPRLSAQPAGLRWWQLGLLAGLGTALAAVLLLWARQALADFTGSQGLKAWLLARGLIARGTTRRDPSGQPANAMAA